MAATAVAQSTSLSPNLPHASAVQGADYALRYHDLHSNRYVRYFRGHGAKVTTLCMSPKSDNFLSAAEDKQVRLWDLRQPHCQAMLQTPGLPTVAYDEQGLVFCVGAESGVVKLYDARNYGQGPFAAFTVRAQRGRKCCQGWTAVPGGYAASRRAVAGG